MTQKFRPHRDDDVSGRIALAGRREQLADEQSHLGALISRPIEAEQLFELVDDDEQALLTRQVAAGHHLRQTGACRAERGHDAVARERGNTDTSASESVRRGVWPGRIVITRQRDDVSMRYPRSSAGLSPARTSDDLPVAGGPDHRDESVIAKPVEQLARVRLAAKEEQRLFRFKQSQAWKRARCAAGRRMVRCARASRALGAKWA